jgi:hypothetical protein
MQFDLFEFSRDTSLRYDVINALEHLDAPTARNALATLVASFPHDSSLPAIDQLLALLDARSSAPFASHAEAARAQACLLAAQDAARQLLEGAAAPWLAQRWREFGARAAHLPYLAQADPAHAAAMFARAQAWPEMEAAVAKIASWRRIPAPLGWMVQARYRQQGLVAAWPLLCELLWMQAAHGIAVMATLNDALLNRLQHRFDADFEAEAGTAHELAWFPAFAILTEPKLAAGLRQAEAGQDSNAERGARLIAQLLLLEQRGEQHAMIEARKRLQGLQPSLFAVYMRTR